MAGGFFAYALNPVSTAIFTKYREGSFDVIFHVTDYEGLDVEGAEITIDGTTKITDVNGETSFTLEGGQNYNYDCRYGGVLEEDSFTAQQGTENIQFGISINKLIRYWSSDKASRFTVSNDKIESVADVTGGHLAIEDNADNQPAYTLDDGIRSIGEYNQDFLDSQQLSIMQTSDSVISLWIKHDTPNDKIQGIIGSHQSSPPYNGWALSVDRDGDLAIFDQDNKWRLNLIFISDGNWNHVLANFDYNNKEIDIYVNNTFIATLNFNPVDSDISLYLGNRTNETDLSLIGLLDNLKIYDDYNFSQTEITNDYNYGRKIHPV